MAFVGPPRLLTCRSVMSCPVVGLPCNVFLLGEAGFVSPASLACLCTLPWASVLGPSCVSVNGGSALHSAGSSAQKQKKLT